MSSASISFALKLRQSNLSVFFVMVISPEAVKDSERHPFGHVSGGHRHPMHNGISLLPRNDGFNHGLGAYLRARKARLDGAPATLDHDGGELAPPVEAPDLGLEVGPPAGHA